MTLITELDLHRIMSGFHGAYATGVASQQGTLTLPDTWFRPPFWDLLMLQLLRPNSSNLPCLCSTFHLEYPLVLSRFYFKIKIKTQRFCTMVFTAIIVTFLIKTAFLRSIWLTVEIFLKLQFTKSRYSMNTWSVIKSKAWHMDRQTYSLTPQKYAFRPRNL